MTEVLIQLPLPMDVAGNLISAFGQMWPDAKILGPSVGSIRFEIPDNTPPAELDPEQVNPHIHPDDAGKLWALTPEGAVIEPAVEVSNWAAQLARAGLANTPEALNYIEALLTDKEGTIRVAVIILNPDGKTPNELRLEAVAEADELRLRVQELEAALWAAKGDAAIMRDL